MNVGGPALQVTGLMQGLDTERFAQRLLVGSVTDGEADYIGLRAPGLPHTVVEGLGRAPRPFDDARALRRLVQEMREFKPHIVHTHTAKAGVLGRTAARLAGVPATVHTFHGHLLHGYFSPRVTSAVTAVERGFARNTTRLVAVGSTVRDELLAAGVGRETQYDVIPPGVDLGPVPSKATARSQLGLQPDAVVVMFVARLTAIKRPERVLEIAARLFDRRPNVVFAVAGEGQLLESLRRRAARNVQFMGWRPDVETLYAASDLTVLTSDNEGMPLSLIEAAMCGVATVAPRVGSVDEVVIDGVSGWLTDADTDALTAAVDSALSDPERLKQAGNAARSHAVQSFGRARLVADYERVYMEIAAEKGFACV